MSNSEILADLSAQSGFERARAQVFIERVVAQLRGRPMDLLPFEQIRAKLGLRLSVERGLRDIPLDHIVGSEGRYQDFTRSFLPRQTRVRDRWKRIYRATEGHSGVPPIEVYQVGDVYFVKDGNHRVSVAREMGAKTIEAYVTEFSSPVPIPVDAPLDQVLLRAERWRFLQQTHLGELHPETPIELTCPGCYEKLAEHIAVHGYFLGKDQQRDISWQEAVNSWFDNIYIPMVRIIREQDVLKGFPRRTEADLYLWIMEHRQYLAQELGQQVERGQAAEHFAEQYGDRLKRMLRRARQALADVVTPEQAEFGPIPGQWRAERVRSRDEDRLFVDILLPAGGSASPWSALEQAVPIARHEQSTLCALYMAPVGADPAREGTLRDEFGRRCGQHGLAWTWITAGGDPAQAILGRAHWADLIVLGRQAEGVPGPTFRTVVRHAPRPVLVTLDTYSPLSKALLAHDGSPEAEEALFVAGYVSRRWAIPLVVLTVEESHRADEKTLQQALTWLNEHGVQAEALLRQGDVAEAILAAVQERGCDWIIMGGSGYSPFRALFPRSTAQRVLREAPSPVLICR